MDSLSQYIPQIIESLKVVKPYKIFLFGSVANGVQGADSDIDLAIILDKNEIPKTYEERLKNKVYVRNAILDLSLEVPIDILVYTKDEFLKLNQSDNPFISEIVDKGEVIYEQAS